MYVEMIGVSSSRLPKLYHTFYSRKTTWLFKKKKKSKLLVCYCWF